MTGCAHMNPDNRCASCAPQVTDAEVVSVLREKNWSRPELARALAAERILVRDLLAERYKSRLEYTATENADRGMEIYALKDVLRRMTRRLINERNERAASEGCIGDGELLGIVKEAQALIEPERPLDRPVSASRAEEPGR